MTNYIPITDEQLNGGVDWIRKHNGTGVVDTPLWVLISVGSQLANLPEWIPVSESQPEEDGEYFVTWITSRVNRPLLEICEYSCGMWDIDNGSAYSDAQVVAWMPLPKPYSCLDFDFDKVKETLKKDNLGDLIVDHTCKEESKQMKGEADGK